MSQLGELLPLIVFFITFKMVDIYWAIGALTATMALVMLVNKIRGKNPTGMQIGSLVLVLVFGGATVFLRNELFLKWKPTVLNWLFALVFLGSQFVGEKTIVQRLMAKADVQLSRPDWLRLNLSWVAFFVFLGGLNIYVAYHYSTDTWVNFKVFGMLGLTLVFVIGQAFYIGRKQLRKT